MSVVGWLVGGIGVAGAVTLVVLWIKSSVDNKTALDERDAALKLEAERIAKEETAAVQARADRAKELDGKVASVRTIDDAVAVLRGELSRAGGTPATDVVSDSGDARRPTAAVATRP